ncbi:MAG: glycosyltransferase family 39 protein [Bryobacteraceae bacterium]
MAIAIGGRPRLSWTPAAAVALAFLAWYFVAAMAPGPDSDGYRYHLGFPRLYLDAGRLIPIREDFYSAFPQATEMLFLYGLRFGGFAVANLLHWTFFAALIAGVYATGALLGSPLTAACAAVAIAASPVVGATSALASADVALAAALWASFHAWLRWRGDANWRWLVAASAAAGFACSVKYTGCTALAVSALFLLAGRARWRSVALSAAVIGVWVAPWLARNYLFFGNPVHPFLSSLFPNPYLSPSSEQAWIAVVRSYRNAAFSLGYVWEVIVRGKASFGILGPLFLLAPIGLLAARRPAGSILIVSGAITAAAWIAGNPMARFAIPSAPFVALAIALALDRSRPARALLVAVTAVHAAMCFPPWIELWNKQPEAAVKRLPWREALRIVPPEETWKRDVPGYEAVRFLDAHGSPNAKVLAFDEQPQFFTSRLLANPYASEMSISAEALLRRAADASSWPTVQCGAVVRGGAPFRFVRLTQRESDPYAGWTIFEAAADAVDASPYPWEADLARDGDDATAWSSNVPRVAGMRFDMAWREPSSSRALHIVTSPAHWGQVAVQTSADGAGWIASHATFECGPRPVSEFPLRSVRELRRRGWTHLLTGRSYPWQEKALTNPSAWGLREVFHAGQTRLLEVAVKPDGE